MVNENKRISNKLFYATINMIKLTEMMLQQSRSFAIGLWPRGIEWLRGGCCVEDGNKNILLTKAPLSSG